MNREQRLITILGSALAISITIACLFIARINKVHTEYIASIPTTVTKTIVQEPSLSEAEINSIVESKVLEALEEPESVEIPSTGDKYKDFLVSQSIDKGLSLDDALDSLPEELIIPTKADIYHLVEENSDDSLIDLYIEEDLYGNTWVNVQISSTVTELSTKEEDADLANSLALSYGELFLSNGYQVDDISVTLRHGKDFVNIGLFSI